MMKKETFKYSKTPYAELHLHLGGAILPRILWHKFQLDHKSDNDSVTLPIGPYQSFNEFQAFFDSPKNNLEEYLEMHKLVEPIQTYKRLDYFINRLMRGAFEFENLSYMEIRHCPYGRTDKNKSQNQRIDQMREIVLEIDRAMKYYSNVNEENYYPIIMKQIICLHSQYHDDVNEALLSLAKEFFTAGIVCGLDIAGGEQPYKDNMKQIIRWYREAKDFGLNTTAHIFETEHTPIGMLDLIPYLDRIGHGIQLPLKYENEMKILNKEKICLEICPTTYFKYNTFTGYEDPRLHRIFKVCDDRNVDIVIGTDNSGMHGVRLQSEFENLLIHEVISYDKLDQYRHNAFKHAFGLSKLQKKMYTKDPMINIDLPNYSLQIKI
ncbi:MAG: hypothetical protein PSV16_12700 [Flavobacterium sp.]|nr:hypothetical protein [Flavobacterium sp.]